jgi:hypothetical protein
VVVCGGGSAEEEVVLVCGGGRAEEEVVFMHVVGIGKGNARGMIPRSSGGSHWPCTPPPPPPPQPPRRPQTHRLDPGMLQRACG